MMQSYVKSPFLLIFLFAISSEVSGQCLGGGIWNGGTPVAGTTDANGKVQGTVSVRAFTAATLASGRPIYNSPSNSYGGFNYKSLTVIRGASFGSGYTYFKLSTALNSTMIHLRISDIRGDGFNTESQRVEGFNNGVPVAATFTDPVNGAFVSGGNVIEGPSSTNSTVQASMRVFFSGDVDSIKITRTGLSDYVIIDLFSRCDILLPFTLSYFSAKLKDKNIKVEWTTGDAHGFSHYNIEKSPDGKNWAIIGVRNINDQSGASGKYEFIDETPFEGRNYYRLKTIDNDGRVTFSAVVLVINSNFRTFNIKAVPNPFASSLKIECNDSNAVHFTIHTAEGRKMAEHKKLKEDWIINTSTWQSGLYFLQVTDIRGNKQTFKLLKQ